MGDVIKKLYGIYHADGGLVGELAYIFGKYAGNVHCSLCDITHNKITMKKEWKSFSKELPIPFDLLHLNERSEDLISESDNHTPCVLAQTENKTFILLSPEELENCNKSVNEFKSILENKLKLHSDG
ncbi:MAG: hypothetical protein CMB47_03900 [Euryarchaeota archaeon]|nr:hypothetical protein [Euryarchaeota archaeon]|tara:strand:- start:13447 stop:13827 length:381 start_codon:yes stop_codon:yes gene_type:complete